MNTEPLGDTDDPRDNLAAAIAATNPSDRLQAALTAGTHPQPAFIPILIERCRVEPDFFVREMLTWALVRHGPAATLPLLLPELGATLAQARSQALHTLSKIGEPSTWPAITDDHLFDEDDDVARTAWRAAAALVPAEEVAELADKLAQQFGRGDRDVQLSLTRMFVDLGYAAAAAVEGARDEGSLDARIHALATERIMDDPDEPFDAVMAESRSALSADEHAG